MAISELTSLNPNYEKSVKDVYREFTQHLVSTRLYGHNLDFLEQVGSTLGRSSSAWRELRDGIDSMPSFEIAIDDDVASIEARIQKVLDLFNTWQPLVREIL